MRCERLSGEDPEALAGQLRALVPAPESVSDQVAAIIAEVRARRDEAVAQYARQFDREHPEPLVVGDDELGQALDDLAAPIRAGLELAIQNVGRVARAGLQGDGTVVFADGHEVRLRHAPLERAAVYVPGGRAPYPSTVVMGVVTARAAGVGEVVVCSPRMDRTVLAACRLTGASAAYRMGGAQAIAALAYGTESVQRVDVIVGPGNLYVQEAKLQVAGEVAIDGFAGPSDLIVIAGVDADPEPLALDLLAQAEHGEGTLVVAVSDSERMLAALCEPLARTESAAVGAGVHVGTLEQALAVAQAFAPEHLQLAGNQAERLAPRATHAGCVFVGQASATAFGDYIAGSNHVLPTNGAARFASALNPSHFRRSFTEVRVGRAAGRLAQTGAPLARAEGFEMHARSMEARIRDNDRNEP